MTYQTGSYLNLIAERIMNTLLSMHTNLLIHAVPVTGASQLLRKTGTVSSPKATAQTGSQAVPSISPFASLYRRASARITPTAPPA